MSVKTSFAIFIASMTICIVFSFSMIIALSIGLVCFAAAGCKLGYSFRDVCRMAYEGFSESLIVVIVMILVGMLTGLWRSSGVISYFVYYGIKMITPHMFIIIAFLMAVILSYALGTSFGVAATAGVILTVLAKSGNVDLLVTGGAVLAGCYFGDRGSPVSSSAALTATITHTDLNTNVAEMMRSAWLPMIISIGIYTALSFANPISNVDNSIMTMLSEDFRLTPWLLLPAAAVLILPLFKVNIRIVISVSIILSFIETVVIQKVGMIKTLEYMILGYHADKAALGTLLDGGGLVSMLAICVILSLSCAFSGIFRRTGMLRSAQHLIVKLARKIGMFGATLVTGTSLCALFCNQTIATIMTVNLVERMYHLSGASNRELAMDIENSAIIMAAEVPWCLAVAVIYQVMGLSAGIMLYSFYPILVSLLWLIFKDRIGIKYKQ